MTARNQNITLTAGDTRTIRFVCRTPDGAPVDLAGGTPFWWAARSLMTPAAEVLVKKSGFMEQVTEHGQAYWSAVFNLQESDTAGLEPRTYLHQCEVQVPGPKTYTVAQGLLTVEPSLVAP